MSEIYRQHRNECDISMNLNCSLKFCCLKPTTGAIYYIIRNVVLESLSLRTSFDKSLKVAFSQMPVLKLKAIQSNRFAFVWMEKLQICAELENLYSVVLILNIFVTF